MPVHALIAKWLVLIQPCDLQLITTENFDVECATFKLVNCLRLDLLDCKDTLLCCSVSTDLVFFELSGYTWPMIQDSRHFSLSLQRWWKVAVKAFQTFMAAHLYNKVWLQSASRSRPTLVFLLEWLETFLFFIEFGCSKGILKELANFILSERFVQMPYFVIWFLLVIYGEIKRSTCI